jgi:GNAT superfamily N-acetyltransferase
MHGVRIVPWQADHEPTLDAVLEAPDELTSQARHRRGAEIVGPNWARTLVAEDEGDPVGAVTVFLSRWHPARLWVNVEVAPLHRRRGIGTALLDAAMALSHEDGRPLRGKVFAGSPAARFAEAHGFRMLHRSRTFRLEASLPVTSPAAFPVDNAAKPDEVAAAFLDWYLRTHTWDPPGELSPADMRASHTDEATESLLVRGDDSSVLAVGCLYDEPDGLLLSGGSIADGAAARAATAVLLHAALRSSAALGRYLLIEADDAASELVAELLARNAAVLDEVHILALG